MNTICLDTPSDFRRTADTYCQAPQSYFLDLRKLKGKGIFYIGLYLNLNQIMKMTPSSSFNDYGGDILIHIPHGVTKYRETEGDYTR